MIASVVTPALILLLGLASGWLSGSGNRNPWFAALVKPGFMPPGWVFPVVWTTLYILMGVALAQVIGSKAPLRNLAIALFAAQLALNLAWSPIFFAGHQIRLGLAVLILLDVVMIATVIVFARIGLWPALLLVPYLVWLGIATALNWSILRLNG
jgi:tryptophan-rich sensory protein